MMRIAFLKDKMMNTNITHSNEEINEGRSGLKFRPVLHALTANPGVEMMSYAAGRENMITLGQGEGDSPTPDFIAKAAFDAMKEGRTTYGPTLGQDALRNALSEYYERIYKLDIPASRCFVTASGSTAMHLSLAALVDKGDEVVAIAGGDGEGVVLPFFAQRSHHDCHEESY